MKKLLIFAVVALSVIGSSSAVFATSVTNTSSGQDFTDSWELYDSGANWVMEYGFNKYAIDEDYTHTKHNSLHHIAKVHNANGTYSDGDGAGSWAEIEVTHSGSYIEYSIEY